MLLLTRVFTRAGVCAMCGIQILDVTYYRQSGVGDVDAAAKRREEDAAKFKAEVEQQAAKRACVPYRCTGMSY